MKGKLICNKNKWFIEEIDSLLPGSFINHEVPPTFMSTQPNLKDGDIVEFTIEDTDEFPYRWAVPVVLIEKEDGVTEEIIVKNQVETHQFDLEVIVGDKLKHKKVIADHVYLNEQNIYKFYNRKPGSNNDSINIAYFPADKTLILSIKKIMVDEA